MVKESKTARKLPSGPLEVATKATSPKQMHACTRCESTFTSPSSRDLHERTVHGFLS